MLSKKQWLGVALAYTLFVFIASLTTIKVTIASSFAHKDKIVHLCIYVVYTIFWFAYFNSEQQKTNYTKAILLAFFTGVLIEILQGTCTEGRTAEVFDVLANSIGIAIATLLLKQPKFIKLLKLKK